MKTKNQGESLVTNPSTKHIQARALSPTTKHFTKALSNHWQLHWLRLGFASVVHAVTVNAQQVTVAQADSSFEALRVQIQVR